MADSRHVTVLDHLVQVWNYHVKNCIVWNRYAEVALPL